mgnify:CR=1 FL=1
MRNDRENKIDIKRNRTPDIKICNNWNNCNYSHKCDTHSMSPTFECNDILKGYKPYSDELKIGDIILFKTPKNGLFTHRIIGIDNNAYITKGDNNLDIDPFRVKYGDILAKVVEIEYH